MVIISDLVKTATGGEDGKILNPANGNTYSCYIELVGPDKIKIKRVSRVSGVWENDVL
jgi:uncharacterized protein (DUF2147 family)